MRCLLLLLRLLGVLAFILLAGCERKQATGRPSTQQAAEPPERQAEVPAPQALVASTEVRNVGKRLPERFFGEDGRWRRLRRSEEENAELEMQIRQLEALGYASGTQTAPALSGVTAHDPVGAYQGVNFYTAGHAPEAILMDMDGRVLHRWGYEFSKVWPDDSKPEVNRLGEHNWRRAHLFANGDILAIYEGLGLIKLDKNSELLWARRNGAHHDLEVLPNGDIVVLTREAHLMPRVHPTNVVLEDFVVVLDRRGREKSRRSLLEAFERSNAHRAIWENSTKRFGDIFHTNSIEVLDGRFVDRHPSFRKGNFLLSSFYLDTIFVVAPKSNKVVWALHAGFHWQHDARSVDDVGIMVFDNQGDPAGSEIEIYDPATGALIWEYHASGSRRFFSATCGAAQPLPNGNTLITESDNGRAFEIARDGTVVWEFYNPHRAGDEDEFIASLFLLERMPRGFPLHWIDVSR